MGHKRFCANSYIHFGSISGRTASNFWPNRWFLNWSFVTLSDRLRSLITEYTLTHTPRNSVFILRSWLTLTLVPRSRKEHTTEDIWKRFGNKKVLLRKRKRHTTRRVASACYAGLSPDGGGGGYPIQSWMGGGGSTPSSPGWGIPHPVLGGGTLGYLPVSTWDLTWTGVPPIKTWDRGTPCPDVGMRYPPPHPDLGMGYLPPPVQTWDWVPPPHLQGRVPPTSVNRLKILPPLILRMWAVTSLTQTFWTYTILPQTGFLNCWFARLNSNLCDRRIPRLAKLNVKSNVNVMWLLTVLLQS